MSNGYKALVVLFLFFLGVFLTGAVGTVIQLFVDLTKAEENSQIQYEHPPLSRDCIYSKNGKRCLVINKFDCPEGWGPQDTASCTDELDECSAALEGIKRWCDPECSVTLEECWDEVQRVKEDCYSEWSLSPELL